VSHGSFPRPWRWLTLSTRKGFASGFPLTVLTAAAMFVLTTVLVPVVTVSEGVRAQQSGSGILTQIAVTPLDAAPDSPALTTSVRNEIAALEGVESVVADVTVGVYAGDSATWSSTLATATPATLPPGIDDVPEGSEVIVPLLIDGTDLSGLVDSPLSIEYTAGTGEQQGELRSTTLHVVAAYDPEWQGHGPNALIGSEAQVIQLLAARAGVPTSTYVDKTGVPALIVTTSDEAAVDRVAGVLRDRGLDARPSRDTLGELPGVVALFPAVFVVVALGAAIVIVLLVGSVVRGSLARRAREFGLLRVRGWSVGDVRRLLVLDVGAGSAIGAIVGAALGSLAGVGLGAVVTESSASAGSLVAVAALVPVPVALAVVVALVVSARALRRDPYLALVEAA
jgi:hypothetical protein